MVCHLFSDNFVIYHYILNFEDRATLENDIHLIAKRCSDWGMATHQRKSERPIFA